MKRVLCIGAIGVALVGALVVGYFLFLRDGETADSPSADNVRAGRRDTASGGGADKGGAPRADGTRPWEEGLDVGGGAGLATSPDRPGIQPTLDGPIDRPFKVDKPYVDKKGRIINPGDSDGDALPDDWEMKRFGTLRYDRSNLAAAPRIDLPASKAGPADTDADGLSDAWEKACFKNLQQGPMDDPDADGFPNWVEHQPLGTDTFIAVAVGSARQNPRIAAMIRMAIPSIQSMGSGMFWPEYVLSIRGTTSRIMRPNMPYFNCQCMNLSCMRQGSNSRTM